MNLQSVTLTIETIDAIAKAVANEIAERKRLPPAPKPRGPSTPEVTAARRANAERARLARPDSFCTVWKYDRPVLDAIIRVFPHAPKDQTYHLETGALVMTLLQQGVFVCEGPEAEVPFKIEAAALPQLVTALMKWAQQPEDSRTRLVLAPAMHQNPHSQVPFHRWGIADPQSATNSITPLVRVLVATVANRPDLWRGWMGSKDCRYFAENKNGRAMRALRNRPFQLALDHAQSLAGNDWNPYLLTAEVEKFLRQQSCTDGANPNGFSLATLQRVDWTTNRYV